MGKMKKLKISHGYTLIEVLTVSGIMALFSLTLIGIFLATMRGGTKSQLISSVHQEGDFALRSMTRMIREAESVDCAGDFTLVAKDGGSTVFSLVEDEGIDKIASNSSKFLTSALAEAADLDFVCYQADTGNQVVTVSFTLSKGQEDGYKSFEKIVQSFATSVSTRQY